jgi:transcriptional regulator with XRE-family HTH domain
MDELKHWMARTGETDRTLSNKVGVSRVQISRIRRSRSGVSPETAKRLEAVTEIPAVRFLYGEEAAQ